MNSTILKKKIVVASTFLLAMSLFSACEKEQKMQDKTVFFNLKMPIESQQKAHFGEKLNGIYPVVWEIGDQIKISLNNASSAVGTVTEVSEDGWNATLRAALADDNSGSYTFSAVYPENGDLSGNTIFVPTTQVARTNALAKNAMILTAQSETYGEFPNEAILNFNHQAAYGKLVFIDVPKDFAATSLEITANQNIAGSLASPSKTITLTNPDFAQPIWVACLPAIGITSLNLKITTAHKTYSATVLPSHFGKSEIAFKKGRVSELEVDMSKVNFTEGEISRGVQIRLKTENSAGGTVNPITANGVGVEWSISNFQSIKIDAAQTYKAALFTDAACTNCVVAWDFLANGGNGTSGANGSNSATFWPTTVAFSNQKFPGFFFSGLTPQTDYFVKITAGNGSYGIKKVTTAASKVVTMPATGSAAEGATILYEDFGELPWGGEPLLNLAGYSTTQRSSLTSLTKASGTNPYATNSALYLVKWSTNMGLFSTIGKAVVGSNSRLKTWGQIIEDGTTNALLVGPGYVKCGASNMAGEIVTPPLSALRGTATVKLSVDMAPYYSNVQSYDSPIYRVEVVDGGTFADTGNKGLNYNYTSGGTRTKVKEATAHITYNWKTYNFTIENVKPTSRIAIGTYRPSGEAQGSSQHRLYLDNVKISVVSYN